MNIEEIDDRLLWLLRRAGDEWGATGVVRAAQALVEASKRPTLYVNSDRTEPVPGDVVTRDDADGATWSYCPHQLRQGLKRWRNTANEEWFAQDDFLEYGSLRLLVDGETGQAVQ